MISGEFVSNGMTKMPLKLKLLIIMGDNNEK